MKSYIRGLAGAFVVVGMLGVVGCGADNESDAAKVAGEKQDAGPVNPDAKKVNIPPQPKTQEEFFKNMPNPKDQAPTSTPSPAPKK